MIIIFDTNGGLCNQFYDIINGINFCLSNNIRFTFRYCAFRNDNLFNWFQTPFEKLFDIKFLNNYELYINYNDIKDKITNDNCFNFNNRLLSHTVFKDENILDQLIKLNKDYVVLYQFWSLYNFKNIIDNTIHSHIIHPSNDIMKKYIEIKNNIIGDEPYNFIHYRYEIDFTKYFNVDVESLDILIDNIKFKNNDLKIFIATSNIKNLIDLHNCKYKNLIYKNDDMLLDLNFEERAFIDYMFGLNSVECYGNRKSSFSVMINIIKQTNNYYA
jgi:hypothetical protein